MSATISIDANQSLTRQFWKNAMPAIVAMLVSGIYVITDGIFIGQYVGHQGLAAVNMAYPVLSLLFGIGLMVGMGAGAVVSIFRGENQALKAAHGVVSAFALIFGCGAIATAALYFGAEPVIGLQGGNGDTMAMAIDYLAVFALFSIAPIAATAIPMLIRNDDSPTLATVIMVTGALLNIGLNALFVVWLGWGLEGAAIATVIANLLVLLSGVYYYLSKHASIRLTRDNFAIKPNLMLRSLVLGSSLLVMHLYGGFVVALHNGLFMEYSGIAAVSAYAVVGYMMTLYYLFSQGVGEGVQPLVSFFHGAQKANPIRKLVFLAGKVVLFSGLVWYALLNIDPAFGIGLFNSDTDVIRSASLGLAVHLSGMFLDGLLALFAVYYMSVNQGGRALAVSVSNMLVQLPFLYWLPKYFGEIGIWAAMPASNVILVAVIAPLFWRDLKRAQQQAQLSPQSAVI
ncbi:MATE family efflux transporter [Paraferrimonas sedimenticola]|uniref:Multidrug export protein MepA n=1 Tax=Paraferrimonas sedimenticola TaxID=375674 RepID=A0AA37VUJ8_9GAMM|nr:MATE family efflux transporter [Paraferrimonas sedimenticola]GLP95711.1 MATE family efflux transporter [Paraferrimonas sedimenticola]